MSQYRILPLPSIDSSPVEPQAESQDSTSPLGLDAPIMESEAAKREKEARKRRERLRKDNLKRTARRTVRRQQYGTLSRRFGRVERFLRDPTPPSIASLRQDVTNILPGRALLFESLPTSTELRKPLQRIPGLELLVEERPTHQPVPPARLAEVTSQEDDEAFCLIPEADDEPPDDGEAHKVALQRRLIAMPSLESLNSLHQSWVQWKQQMDEIGPDFEDTSNVLDKVDIRAWQPSDRYRVDIIEQYLASGDSADDTNVQLGVELWYRQDELLREQGYQQLKDALVEVGGEVLFRNTIRNIHHDFALVEVPLRAVYPISDAVGKGLLSCDSVRFIHPPTWAEFTAEGEDMPAPVNVTDLRTRLQSHSVDDRPPIAALYDGDADESHVVLKGRTTRLRTNRPLEVHEDVARSHGTKMASIMIHGDLCCQQSPVCRSIVVCPVPMGWKKSTEGYRFLSNFLASAIEDYVQQMKEGVDGADPMAPEVFLINVSLGIPNENLLSGGTGRTLVTQLDALSYKYGVLFIISAGNSEGSFRLSNVADKPTLLSVDGRHCWPDEPLMIHSLLRSADGRRITTPAEARNSITVGARYKEWTKGNWSEESFGPYFSGDHFPNTYSAMGLGLADAVKPEILMPAGKHPVRYTTEDSGGLWVESVEGEPAGILAGTIGDDDEVTALSHGTSSATALATHFAQKIFEKLELDGAELDEQTSWLEPAYRSVAVKALLVHAASWSSEGAIGQVVQKQIGKPRSGGPLQELTRLLGYGMPDADHFLSGAPNKVTFVGCRTIHGRKSVDPFAIPVPRCIKNTPDGVKLAVTLAWLTPVAPEREGEWVQLSAIVSPRTTESVGLERERFQPPVSLARNGTVFHQHYRMEMAESATDDEVLLVEVRRRAGAGFGKQPIPLALAATIEGPEGMKLYDDAQSVQFRDIPEV